MTSLIQEIISVYSLLNPSQLTAAASNRVCNALALLQCVASHNDTRTLFLSGRPSPSSGTRTSSGLANVLSFFFLSGPPSAHPPLSLPLPQHHVQVAAV